MPLQTRHPGVYVEEVPSGVHTIVGVSTSVTAFVGATRMGPVDTPVRVRSVADYVREFGAAIDATNPLGHCVAHFFANGGSEAIVVRAAAAGAVTATAALAQDGHPDVTILTLSANGPGAWANHAGGAGLEAGVTHDDAASGRFDLTLVLRGVDPRTGAPVVVGQEAYAGLSLRPDDPRFAPSALASSHLARASLAGLHGTSRGKEALDGTLTFKPDNNKLKLAVDGGAAVEVELFASQLAANATTTKPRAAVVEELNAVLAPLGVVASLVKVGNEDNVLLLESVAATPGSAVVVTPSAADAAALLHLGAAQEGVEVAVPSDLSVATQEAVGFDGGSDGVAPGAPLVVADDVIPSDETGGIYSLGQLQFPRFNLLCLPGLDSRDDQQLGKALAYCKAQRAFLLVDTPPGWQTDPPDLGGLSALGEHGAIYYPRLVQSEPAPGGITVSLDLPACGAVAGAIARTDAERGVWKAPAGLETGLVGFGDLSVPTDDAVSDLLNPKGANALRSFPGAGTVVWGARTLKGDDTQASEFKYVPVRRLTDHIASSLYLGTQFAVFEPNDPDLWGQLRLAVGTFMRGLFRRGAFQQSEKRAESDSFYVVCDETVNPQSEIDLGRVNVVVGFAPLKPAEFVVVSITQISQLEE